MSDHPALTGLDDVPWARLLHAYGSAEDVPVLLEGLTGTREQQEHALYELYGNIWHQGTVYEATAYAVPFLARLTLAEPLSVRDEILSLLADIAMGSSYLDVHQDLVPGGLTDDDQSALGKELQHVKAARSELLDDLHASPQAHER